MKIVLICEAVFPENKGGLEKWMASFAQSLARFEFDVEYLNACGINEIRDNVKYTSVGSKQWHYIGDGKRSIKQAIEFSFAIRHLIRDTNPDVIYSVQAPIITLFSLVLRFHKPWTLIVEWIEIWSLKYWRSYLGYFRGTIAYFLQSIAKHLGDVRVVFTKRCLNQLGKQDPRNVLLPGLYMSTTNAMLDSFKKRENLLFLGRFIGEKQPFLALEVARNLRNLGWTGCLNLVGTGPLAEQLRLEVSKNQMYSYVEIFENASSAVLDECFSNTFLLLHPSRREGYGLAMIESAERGVPTLLIDYPENTSVEINVPSKIVASTDDSKFLAKLALAAYQNQEKNFNRLKTWREDILPGMSANKSVEKIVSLIYENSKK